MLAFLAAGCSPSIEAPDVSGLACNCEKEQPPAVPCPCTDSAAELLACGVLSPICCSGDIQCHPFANADKCEQRDGGWCCPDKAVCQ